MDNKDLIINFLKTRRSCRNYKGDEVKREILEEIVDLARYSPSGMNRQDFKITIVGREDLKERIINVLRRQLNDESYNGFYGAPYYILLSAPEENGNGLADCSALALNIMYAAKVYGLATVWVNQFKNKCHEKEVRALLDDLNIEENHVIWASLSLGYPQGEVNKLRENKSKVEFLL